MVTLTDLVFNASASTNEIHKVNLLQLLAVCVKEVAGIGRIRTSETTTTKVGARLIWVQHLGAQAIAYPIIVEVHKVLVATCMIPCGITTRS